MNDEPRVLPLVLRIREQIDKVFTRYVGPISAELCSEEFARWLREGQVGPSAVHRYISHLSRYITEDTSRREFVQEASKCIQVLSGAKS